jgi:ABC-type Fe3+/spermidine/putrescine transport system ATPase subunit
MALEIDKLSRRFGNNWILRDVGFTASPGRIFGILGASGSGKSALLDGIAGNGKISGGSVRLDGKDLAAVKPRDRGIELISNDARPGFMGLFSNLSRSESSGERQAAAVEKALINDSRVLLLDEPFSEMDAALREEYIRQLRHEASHGRIIVFASSDFDQLTMASDEIAMVDKTILTTPRSPQELYENPPTVSAARLTGENNLFEARRLTSSDDDLPEFMTIEGNHRIFAQRVDKSRLAPINSNSVLAIRPEQVVMSMGASFPEDNLLKAVVRDIKFRGPTSLIEFDAGGLKLLTRVFKVVGLKVGDECMLGLPPHRIIILKH